MNKDEAHVALSRMLQQTRTEEVDCDEFAERLAVYVEGGLDDSTLGRLMDHHRVICPDCDEALEILRQALGQDSE